jgi:hypothetical protein
MKISEAPAFLVERRTLKPGKTRAPLKTLRKKARQGAIRVDGDTGTAEMKKQQKIIMEVRDRAPTPIRLTHAATAYGPPRFDATPAAISEMAALQR